MLYDVTIAIIGCVFTGSVCALLRQWHLHRMKIKNQQIVARTLEAIRHSVIAPHRVALELLAIGDGEEQIHRVHVADAGVDLGFEVETCRGWYMRFERLNSGDRYIVGRVVAPDAREVELADWMRDGLIEPLELLRLAHPGAEERFLDKVENAFHLDEQLQKLELLEIFA